MVEDITRSKWVECLAIVGGLLLPGIMTIGVANSANDGEVFGRNWTSEPIADIQPDITRLRHAGDAEVLPAALQTSGRRRTRLHSFLIPRLFSFR